MENADFIADLLERASQITQQNFGLVTGRAKSADPNQVLTDTDLEVGQLIVDEIRAKFPKDNIIDEESGVIDNSGSKTWVVDPIDGTSNFAVGLPEYGIMIGLLEGATPIAGGLALPEYRRIYVAAPNTGVLLGGDPLPAPTNRSLAESLVAYGIDGHPDEPKLTQREVTVLGELCLSIRNLRTSNSAYDFGRVLEGKYGLWMNQTTKIWDNVAQDALMRELGGVFTAFHGEPMDYSDPLSRIDQNFTVCTGMPRAHAEAQVVIRNALPEDIVD